MLVASATSYAPTQSSIISQDWESTALWTFQGPCDTGSTKDHTCPSPFMMLKLKITGFYWIIFGSASHFQVFY